MSTKRKNVGLTDSKTLKKACTLSSTHVSSTLTSNINVSTQKVGWHRYTKGKELGKGTFGTVYLATDNEHSGTQVAVKKMRMENTAEGVGVVTLREIKLLKEFQLLPHPNIISLLDIFSHKERLHLVFELCLSDLEVIIQDSKSSDTKTYMLHILRSVSHCHNNWIMHVYLKPNNFFLGVDHQLKLGDFGAAKEYVCTHNEHTRNILNKDYFCVKFVKFLKFLKFEKKKKKKKILTNF
eukprot:GSMAST32.ASY1.ANO1.903.1 assembled CDS